MTTDVDVAIVGYGPVGQTLASLLGRRGWRVAAFDRKRELYPLPRACHLDHEGMRILQAVGIAEAVEAAMEPAREYLMLRGDLSVLSDLPRGWETPTGWEASYHFYQPDIEGLFDSTAKQTRGVAVTQGVGVKRVEEGQDSVSLVLDDGTTVTARYVIGADGANSTVREAVGIDREDLGFEATWIVNDVELNEGFPKLDVPDTGQVLDPEQPRHMAWLGGRHYRWEFMLVDGMDLDEAVRPENVWAKLSRWVDPETAVLQRSAGYTFRSLVAETFDRGRILLAGDAAHLMPPFMGQGMVSGMRDAITLTWVLDLVLRGAAPAEFLHVYSEIRRPHVTAYIAESVRVGKMVCETDPVKAAERDRELAARTTTPSPFQPRVTAFVGSGPLAGSLAVQPRVRVGDDAKLLDDVTGFGFTVLTTDPADTTALSEVANDVLSALGAQTVVLGDQPGAYAETEPRFATWAAAVGATWVLVRPDGYVYDSGVGRDALERTLAAVSGELGGAATPSVTVR